jgi:predicted secreted Zn-dependent protease
MPRYPVSDASAILLAAIAFGVMPAAADPTVSRTIDYYDVSGADAREVRASLNRSGPISSTDNKRYDATARWWVSWKYQYKRTSSQCGIASVTTDVKVTITFPRLKTDASTPEALKMAFATYTEKLMLHEEGHVQNGIDIAKRIEAAIRVMPPEPTCEALGQAANKLGNALIKEANQADIDYDARTRHGATQGARFP